MNESFEQLNTEQTSEALERPENTESAAELLNESARLAVLEKRMRGLSVRIAMEMRSSDTSQIQSDMERLQEEIDALNGESIVRMHRIADLETAFDSLESSLPVKSEQ